MGFPFRQNFVNLKEYIFIFNTVWYNVLFAAFQCFLCLSIFLLQVSSDRDEARNHIVARQDDEMKEKLLSHAGEPAKTVEKMKRKLQAKHDKGE